MGQACCAFFCTLRDIFMSTPFELPTEMTIYSAVEVRDTLLAWVTEQTAKGAKALEISARRSVKSMVPACN
jgi:hypothetical protein